jgi:hypothetical protein
MENVSHLKMMSMSLLQTCSYITDQMQFEVGIDVNKFLQSFSIKTDRGPIHPPSWIPTENGSVIVAPSTPVEMTSSSDLHANSTNPFNMEDYRKCRQAEAIRWINLREKRASIIPRLQPVSAEEYQALRDAVTSESGPLCRKDKKDAGMLTIEFDDSYLTHIHVATKRTTQKQKAADRIPNVPKDPLDLLKRRKHLIIIKKLHSFTDSLYISETKRKRHDLTPISKSQASSNILDIVTRKPRKL